MSRIGKMPVPIPAGVTVAVSGADVNVKGPKGELSYSVCSPIKARVNGAAVLVENPGDQPEAMSLHGLARTQIANMITGVTTGYSKELELQGVGFKAAVQGAKLTLVIGYSHPVVFEAPAGILITVKDNKITVAGSHKQRVGEVAARIRAFYKPEPYKGKGIRYVNEYVRRKAGKTVA
ncbi:MAG: 50S ribosomal protein L6 [Kiritimatiellia bacterium]